jgi:chloramphenicol 3-O phosphotransferase
VDIRLTVRIGPAALAGSSGGAFFAAGSAGPAHRGVAYDVEVDTTHTEALECARTVARSVVSCSP